MFGFKTGASAKDNKANPPAAEKKQPIDPKVLGTGAAAKAGDALKNRRAHIDAAAGYANGGKVVGPGTGTSDDIATEVPEGSYIMPADSTQQIGEQNLAEMGSPVPVNLSNGEYQLPPEQVHAVGVQALDAMKNATHVPAALQNGAKGFQPRGHEQGKPELFFADGGVVEEPRKKQTSFDITNTPAAQRAAGIVTNAEAAQRAAGVAPATPAAATPAPAAPPAPKVAPGYSSNPVIADAQATQATQDASSQAKAVGGDNPARAAQMQAQYNQPVTKGTANAAGFTSSAGERLTSFGNGVVNTAAGAGKALLATPLDLAHQGIVAAVDGDTRSMPGGGQGFRANAFQQLDKGMGQVASAFDGAKAGARNLLGVKEAAPQPGQPSPGLIASAEAAPVQPAAPQAVPSSAVAVASAAGPRETAPTPQGNGYQQTGINGIVGKKDENGQYSFTNEGAAVAGAAGQLRGSTPGMASGGQGFAVGGPGAMSAPEGARVLASGSNYKTPAQEFAQLGSSANLGNGVGTFSQAEPGSAQEALGRFERANQEREQMIAASRRGQVGEGGGRVTVVGDSGRLESQQRQAFAAASTPHAGSQNGQLTIGQINAMRGLVADERSDATSRANAQAGNAAALAGEQMRQAGADQRFAQSHALDQQRTAAEVESKGFANRSAQRIEKLYEQYDKAAPEDRPAIAEQLRVLSGKSEGSLKDNFIKVKRPIYNADGHYMGDQEELVDLRGGQSAQQQAQRTDASKFEKGKVYTDANGNQARWDGAQFVAI